ncbi:hypothetical protein BBO_08561 [Beauveria brongniartii RCEF 3172]|uniref:Uncharacterized protein n=1 Tax=Beauveria brongniartii RCEF 3172 TaxID=1081107 RepID=A0A166XEC5_9HYPO|nr:hypothetical protein BBO_08561 [Beauveria brongniartii RCEF 3172]
MWYCQFPTSSRASTEVYCKDQPDDQLQQGKREREDQGKSKAPFRASRSPNWKQEEGCHTTSAIDLTGEGFGQMNGADSDLSPRAKQFECYEDIAWLKKSYLEEAENHSNVTYERNALRRVVRDKNRQVMKLNEKISRLRGRNIQLVHERNALRSVSGDKNRQVMKLNKKIRRLCGRNIQLAQDKEQLAQGKEQLDKSYGSLLGQDWCLQNSHQRTVQLMKEKIEHYESSAREKDEEIRQRGRDVEELKKTIQEINNHKQHLLELSKSQQQTNTALVELLRKMDVATREQDKYNHQFYEPTRPNDGSLPVIPGLGSSAPPAFFATNQQQIPVLSSSPDHVNFGPSYNGRFAYPVSSPQTPTLSPRSQVWRESSLQAPSLQGYQDVSWPGSSNY